MTLDKARNLFIDSYGEGGEIFSFHSPGRVNLIGEHTDYNGGYILPCALNFGTYGIVRPREDNIINFISTNFPTKVTANLENLKYEKEHDWANYLKGVILEVQKSGYANKIKGMDILISGNIPNGAGLSSSASIQILMATILNTLFSLGIPPVEIAILAQKSEHNFIGVNCGIMDQFTVVMGKENNAIFLNCKTMKYDYIPLNLGDYVLIISNTNKSRTLVDSKYNERRTQCEKAVEYFDQELNIEFLGELSVEDFEEKKHLIKDEIILKRAEHVVYEDQRVLSAVECLKAGDLKGFGKLMTESHNSLKNLYEVTGLELDTLVEEALKIDGTLGSRMTGAGFGGCTVSIVKESAVPEFIKTVGENYFAKTGIKADFYTATTGNGASII